MITFLVITSQHVYKKEYFLLTTGALQRKVRERGRDVRIDPQLQGVLRRERRQQAGSRVSPASQRNHLRF